jgi:hypothetical protein
MARAVRFGRYKGVDVRAWLGSSLGCMKLLDAGRAVPQYVAFTEGRI